MLMRPDVDMKVLEKPISNVLDRIENCFLTSTGFEPVIAKVHNGLSLELQLPKPGLLGLEGVYQKLRLELGRDYHIYLEGSCFKVSYRNKKKKARDPNYVTKQSRAGKVYQHAAGA